MESKNKQRISIVNENLSASVINHMPIIKDYAMKIGLVDTINQLIPSQMAIDPGTIFLGMVLDTLSGRTPLYRLDEFFKHQDTELLLGKKVKTKNFSDYNVGRVIDKAYETGAMKIFSAISNNAVRAFNVKTKHVSFDTTSVNAYGDYDLYSENDSTPFRITNGYSKDHRPDLKQFLISLLCVDRNVPILGTIEDGNKSDKVINNKILSSISKNMAKTGIKPGGFIYIADSAMVTKKNLEKIADDIVFITRLPVNYKECNRVIKEAIKGDDWNELGILSFTKATKKRPSAYYRSYETRVNLYKKNYRAIVIHSSNYDKRRQKRIDRELKSDRNKLEKRCKALCKKRFYCRADAEVELEALEKYNSKYYFTEVIIEEMPKHKKGRPKNGIKEVDRILYQLAIEIKENRKTIFKLREEAGCFVLISNEVGDYDSKAILKAYKDQHGIEQNFSFLKDPVIVNSIFLNKAERIEVLGMVLLLSLLIWRLIERSMRQYVDHSGKDLPGWKERRTERPTSFMLTTKFIGIIVIKIGNKRQLGKPLSAQQKEYLLALNVDPEIFVTPKIE